MTTPKTAPRRVALYARVSTLDKHYDPETQLRQLREHVQHRGLAIAGEFADYASGRDNARAEYGKLLDAARRRDVDVVLVWRYDRFARSTHALINALTEFHALGVDSSAHRKAPTPRPPRASWCSPSWPGLRSSRAP